MVECSGQRGIGARSGTRSPEPLTAHARPDPLVEMHHHGAVLVSRACPGLLKHDRMPADAPNRESALGTVWVAPAPYFWMQRGDNSHQKRSSPAVWRNGRSGVCGAAALETERCGCGAGYTRSRLWTLDFSAKRYEQLEAPRKTTRFTALPEEA